MSISDEDLVDRMSAALAGHRHAMPDGDATTIPTPLSSRETLEDGLPVWLDEARESERVELLRRHKEIVASNEDAAARHDEEVRATERARIRQNLLEEAALQERVAKQLAPQGIERAGHEYSALALRDFAVRLRDQ